jgi:hypothetical protein
MTMRIHAVALIVLVSCSSLAHAATAQAADDNAEQLQPYDAGYAYQASLACPNVKLVVPMGPQAQARAQFQRGVAMFERVRALQQLDSACRGALNLYDSKTGKAAKLLDAQ